MTTVELQRFEERDLNLPWKEQDAYLTKCYRTKADLIKEKAPNFSITIVLASLKNKFKLSETKSNFSKRTSVGSRCMSIFLSNETLAPNFMIRQIFLNNLVDERIATKRGHV